MARLRGSHDCPLRLGVKPGQAQDGVFRNMALVSLRVRLMIDDRHSTILFAHEKRPGSDWVKLKLPNTTAGQEQVAAMKNLVT
mmetsp:Transcript_46205/g.83212  ORF Transcript_46205/g.83212 Transcript_46205/m.83212 type:complete len:83 (+) Transcript_46205:60-308(+)